jgi:SAM-dependent methyltransferase
MKFKVVDGSYLELTVSERFLLNSALNARDEAVLNNLKILDLDKFITSTGSPPKELILDLIEDLKLLNIIPDIHGCGVEFGAGLAILSCGIVKNFVAIDQIFAIEGCKAYAVHGINLISNRILKKEAEKIIPCFGSFEEIPIKDNSIDFVIQIESLHHAENLIEPVREGFRLLKEGGYFLSIDRSWIDSVDDSTLENMLNHRYDKSWLLNKGFSDAKIMTRRDNGEHEYRDCEWKETFLAAGFKNLVYLPIHPKVTFKFLIKRFICLIRLHKIFNIKVQSRPGLFRGLLAKRLSIDPRRIGGQLISGHPRPLVVSVWQK